MSKSRLLTLGVAALLLATAGCGGGTAFTPIDPNPSGLPTLGEIEQMIQASNDKDTDGDYIPDEIERDTLKTDPNDRDTDRDGLPDNYEIFGEGIYDYGDFVPDEDKDAIIAARDHDDNDDKINDGQVIDTDGDTIPNYLEYYGYVYDWLTGRFVSCEDIDCTGMTVYKTDPLQRSTDQDPYPDNVEASGLNMDVSVTEPGVHPLVPACPKLVVELAAYTVTLKENVTYSRGGSLEQGTTWTRETTRTHSQTMEHSWEVGITAGVGFEGGSPTGKVEVSATYGGKWSGTNETSNSVSRGDSVVQEANWSEARSVDPTEAAHVKLMLKAHNIGEICMSDVVPTLTLRVAGLNVATFEPGNAAIKLLPPQGTYPADDGVYWVVDTDAQNNPIALTMNELRAFESGAPLSVAVTQVKSDVMKLDSDGNWQMVGDASEFGTRCDASCADIFLDMGEGSSMHAMVFCGCRPSEPIVTFGDALEWCANGYEDKDGLWVSYVDKEGFPRTANVENWHFVFDRETWILNGIDPDDLENTIPADFRMSQMLLHPDAQIFGKAPRDPQRPKPDIHYAYIDYDAHKASVCATDYQGVDEVTISIKIDPGDGSAAVYHVWPMEIYTEESNLYGKQFTESEWGVVQEVLDRQMDPSSGGQDEIKAVVRSLNGESSERPFGLVPPNPQAVEPIIDFVRLDASDGTLYARVLPNDNYPKSWTDSYPVQWVNAYHPSFLGSTPGMIKLLEPVNSYEDYYGWVGTVPAPWMSQTPIKVVAYVAPGVYSEHYVTPTDLHRAYAIGSAQFHLQHFYWNLCVTDDDYWKWQWMDLDNRNGVPGGTLKINNCGTSTIYPYEGTGKNNSWQSSWNPPAWRADFWARWDDGAGQQGWKLYFNVPWAKVAPPGGTYESVTGAWAEAQIPANINPSGSTIATPDTYVLRTSAGRIAKLQITAAQPYGTDCGWKSCWSNVGRNLKFNFRYLVFDSAVAHIAHVPSPILYDNNATPVKIDGSNSTGDIWRWSVKSGPGGYTLDDDDKMIATLTPADPTVGGYEQTYVVELVIDSGQTPQERDEVTIKFIFPMAVIDAVPDPVEFDPGDAREIKLIGSNSTHARTYSWTIVEAPDMAGGQTFDDATIANPVFEPDDEGQYKIKLIINEGDADEDTATVIVNVKYN